MEYIIESFPVKARQNIRTRRSKLFREEKYRIYNASKWENFYSIKIQLVTTADGIPVEMYLVQGAEHDSQILKRMYADLPPESSLYCDSAYTNYEIEEMFRKVEQIDLAIILSFLNVGAHKYQGKGYRGHPNYRRRRP